MKSLVLVVVLVAVICSTCKAGFFGDDKTEKVDPVTLLSRKLNQLIKANDLASNVKAAREHEWKADPEAAQAPFMEAVNAFNKINADDACDPENWFSLRTLRRLIGPTKTQFLLADKYQQYRIYRFLDEIEEKVKRECFRMFEEKWKSDPEKDNRYNEKFPELEHLGDLISLYATKHVFQRFSDIKELNGAIQLMKDSLLKKPQLQPDSVKSVLGAIHMLKMKKDSLKSISKKEAERLIEEYLVKPCEELRKQPEVTTFFEPITSSGDSVLLDDWVKGESGDLSQEEPNWSSIYWSARWAFCEVLVTKIDIKKLASKVARSRV